MILFLSRINDRGSISFDLENINDNFTNITYLSKSDISSEINKNKDNISSNLITINNNETKINNISSNEIYLKNLENILLCSYNYEINFNNVIPFFKKYFNIFL